MNRYFKTIDKVIRSYDGFKFNQGWWSRFYEYAWAIDQVQQSAQIVADMGAGYVYRPFKDMLADKVREVYAIDSREELLTTWRKPNVKHIVANFCNLNFEDNFFDQTFCISVLEDVPNITVALQEFARCTLGNIVITIDAIYDERKDQHDLYRGIDINEFVGIVERLNLEFVGEVSLDKTDDIVFNEELNLCVFRAILRKRGVRSLRRSLQSQANRVVMVP